MPRPAAAFKETDLARAIKVVLAQGLEVARTEITIEGQSVKIAVVSKPDPTIAPADAALEAWKAKHARSS